VVDLGSVERELVQVGAPALDQPRAVLDDPHAPGVERRGIGVAPADVLEESVALFERALVGREGEDVAGGNLRDLVVQEPAALFGLAADDRQVVGREQHHVQVADQVGDARVPPAVDLHELALGDVRGPGRADGDLELHVAGRLANDLGDDPAGVGPEADHLAVAARPQ
jgi:hypothetical protein